MAKTVSAKRKYSRFQHGDKPTEEDLNENLVDKIDKDMDTAFTSASKNQTNLAELKARVDEHADNSGNLTQAAPEFTKFDGSPTFMNARQFSVVGNFTNQFLANRAIQLVLTGSSPFSHVKGSTYDSGTGKTTVTLFDEVLDNTVSAVKLASLTKGLPKIAEKDLDFDPATQDELDAHKTSSDHDRRYPRKDSTSIQVVSGHFRVSKSGEARVETEDNSEGTTKFRRGVMRVIGEVASWLMQTGDGATQKTFVELRAVEDEVRLVRPLNANSKALKNLPAPEADNDAARKVDLPNPRGAYSSSTTYRYLDLVDYQGSSYVYTGSTPSSGTAPPTPPWKLLAKAGDKGGLPYTFSTETTMADPGSGKVRFDNGTLASVTKISVSDTMHGGGDIGAYIDVWDDSDSSVKGYLILQSNFPGGSRVAVYSISSLTSQTGYKEITVIHVAGAALFSDDEEIVVDFIPTGDKGDKGGLPYTFSTETTMADPGSGKVRFDNGTLASVTKISISDTMHGGGDIGAYIDVWDDSDSSVKGYLILQSNFPGGSRVAVYSISSLTSQTGYKEITVIHVAGAALFSDDEEIVVDFVRTGDRGPRGLRGFRGYTGAKPSHQWSGTRLRFQNPDGTWGSYVDLEGPPGPSDSDSDGDDGDDSGDDDSTGDDGDGDGNACFLPNTRVLTADGWKLMGQVRIGDWTASPTGPPRQVVAMERGPLAPGLFMVQVIVRKDGVRYTLCCSCNHPLAVPGGFGVFKPSSQQRTAWEQRQDRVFHPIVDNNGTRAPWRRGYRGTMRTVGVGDELLWHDGTSAVIEEIVYPPEPPGEQPFVIALVTGGTMIVAGGLVVSAGQDNQAEQMTNPDEVRNYFAVGDQP